MNPKAEALGYLERSTKKSGLVEAAAGAVAGYVV